MPTQEFDKPAGHIDAPPCPAVAFPEQGEAPDIVLRDVSERFGRNAFASERNFSISYSGIPSDIALEVEKLSTSQFFVEWASSESGTMSMEREAVGMMISLLGGDEGSNGFITSGGTESNLAAMRIARNLGDVEWPEFIAPVTMHFSFRLGAELMRIKLVEIDVDPITLQPDLDAVRAAINENTVGMACSAPAANLGTMDPVAGFAEIAHERGIYLHVDAAFGGFIFPFMRDLGLPAPDFDLSIPGVSSISTDGHKLGLLPLSTGFFILRDGRDFESIPTEETLIHTTSSTKHGSRAAAAWATFRCLGRSGYVDSTSFVLRLRDIIADGVTEIPGIDLAAPRLISLLSLTSSEIDLEAVHKQLSALGWGQGFGVVRDRPFMRLSIHPSRSEQAAHGFVDAFASAVKAV